MVRFDVSAEVRPVTIVALLATLVLIFAFQAENIIRNWIAVLLLAIPILIQVYFNSSLTYLLMRFFKVRHSVATPGALIGASNFFELAVAVAITLFGPTSPAALATVVGVLVEVPVMLSVCQACIRSKRWYAGRGSGDSAADTDLTRLAMFTKILVATDASDASSELIACLPNLRKVGAQHVVLAHVINVETVGAASEMTQQQYEAKLED